MARARKRAVMLCDARATRWMVGFPATGALLSRFVLRVVSEDMGLGSSKDQVWPSMCLRAW
jgi:hypothetical protein